MPELRPTPANRMSEAEIGRIILLHEQGWGERRIAAAMERHRSTVRFALIRNGCIEPQPTVGRDCTRYGRPVRAFTAEEDEFLETKRASGMAVNAIVREWPDQFGYPRPRSSLCMRLLLLACRPEAA